jgi:hypothetical protein
MNKAARNARDDEIVRLHDQGMTYRPIADRLGCAVGTVGNAVKRSRNGHAYRDTQTQPAEPVSTEPEPPGDTTSTENVPQESPPDDFIEAQVVDLPTLASVANRWHADAENARANMVEYAVRAGEALVAAKELCKKSKQKWMPWVKENFDGSHDLANKYMRLAKNSERVLKLDRELSMREALHTIGGLALPGHAGGPPKQHEEACLWGGLPDPGAQQVDLSLRPNTPEAQPEERGRVAEREEWTDAQRERMCAAWKARLQDAARDVDSAIDRLVAAAHEAHPPGSADGDAKTQARFAANIARWVDTLGNLNPAIESAAESLGEVTDDR